MINLNNRLTALLLLALSPVLPAQSIGTLGEVSVLLEDASVSRSLAAAASPDGTVFVVVREERWDDPDSERYQIASCQATNCQPGNVARTQRAPAEMERISQLSAAATVGTGFGFIAHYPIETPGPRGGMRRSHAGYRWHLCEDAACSRLIETDLPQVESRSGNLMLTGIADVQPSFVLSVSPHQGDPYAEFWTCRDARCSEVNRNRLGAIGQMEIDAIPSNNPPVIYVQDFDANPERNLLLQCSDASCNSSRLRTLNRCLQVVGTSSKDRVWGKGCGRGNRSLWSLNDIRGQASIERVNLSVDSLQAVQTLGEHFLFLADTGTRDDPDLRLIRCADPNCNSIVGNQPATAISGDYPSGLRMLGLPGGRIAFVWGDGDVGGIFLRTLSP